MDGLRELNGMKERCGEAGRRRYTSRLSSGMEIIRSKRPGRVSALSKAVGLLVAAVTTTPVLSSNPSISCAQPSHPVCQARDTAG